MKPQIIGLSGKARSGKDTLAAYLCGQHGYTRLAFADKLKEAVRLLFRLSTAQTDGLMKEVVDDYWKKTPREIMQVFGTEVFRNTFGQNFWVEALKREIEERLVWEGTKRNYVITDVRFPNEVEAVKSWGGQVWRLERPDGPVATNSGHPSEVALDDFKDWDWTIRAGSGQIQLLYKGADAALSKGENS